MLAVTMTVDPLLVWGLYTRGLGAVFFIAIFQLWWQWDVLMGSRSIWPLRLHLRAVRRDYPHGLWRLAYHPTLFWISSSDWFIRVVLVLGTAASLQVVYGGAYVTAAFAVCFAVYLSLASALMSHFPWDMLLLEMGFQAMFLPSSLPVITDTLRAAEVPAPVVVLALRMLVFRLMFGFGKKKFSGCRLLEDSAYLKGFFIGIPLPTPIGFAAHYLPLWMHRLGLVFMFVAEIIVPFFFFATAQWRVMAAIANVLLQVGIQMTGNFAFFNLLTIVLTVPLLDAEGLPDLGWWGWIASAPAATLVFAVLLPGWLLCVALFDSWVNPSWYYWPSLQGLPLIGFYRFLSNFRIFASYGVFPPGSFPASRTMVVFEGSADGKAWKEYRFRFQSAHPEDRLPFAAPLMPRFDFFVFYTAAGVFADNFLGTLVAADPYVFTRETVLHRVAQRLLEGGSPVDHAFAVNPFPPDKGQRPKYVRVVHYLLTPRPTYAEGGNLWTRTFLGLHVPPTTLKDPAIFWDRDWLPDPTSFHWDNRIQRLRSPRFQNMLESYKQTHNSTKAALEFGSDVPFSEFDRFWNDGFVGDINNNGNNNKNDNYEDDNARLSKSKSNGKALFRDWASLKEARRWIGEHMEPDAIHSFYVILNRLTSLLIHRMEPYFMKKVVSVTSRPHKPTIQGRPRPHANGGGAGVAQQEQQQQGEANHDEAGRVADDWQQHSMDDDDDDDDEEEEEHHHMDVTTLDVPCYFHLGLVAHLVIGRGRKEYERVLKKPWLAVPYASALSAALDEQDNPESRKLIGKSMVFLGVFHYEALALHAHTWRVLSTLILPNKPSPVAPGFFYLLNFLLDEFKGEFSDEYVPRFVMQDDYTWRLAEVKKVE